MCDAVTRAECEDRFGTGSALKWACNRCSKKPVAQISLYTHKLLRVGQLIDSGFPVQSDLLTYREWLDLGKVKQVISAYERTTMMSSMIAGIFGGGKKK